MLLDIRISIKGIDIVESIERNKGNFQPPGFSPDGVRIYYQQHIHQGDTTINATHSQVIANSPGAHATMTIIPWGELERSLVILWAKWTAFRIKKKSGCF